MKVMVLFMDWGYFVHQSTQKRRERASKRQREREEGEGLLQAI